MANARLIAAAPDLLEALRALVDYTDECDCGVLVGEDEDHAKECKECQMLLAGRAAIDKSEGRG